MILDKYEILQMWSMWKRLSIQQWVLRKYYPVESYNMV